MKLIGITGRKRSGKDSLATIIKDYSREEYTRVSFADPMRQIMEEVCLFPRPYNYETMKEEPVLVLDTTESFFKPMVVKMLSYNADNPDEIHKNGIKFMKFSLQFNKRRFSPREFLQKLGTEFGREQLGENIWVDMLISSLDKEKSYIIPDVRFDNEAEAIRKAGGKVIKVIRPSLEEGPVEDNHSSEAGVYKGLISDTLIADSLSEMKRKWISKQDNEVQTTRCMHGYKGCLGCYECSGGDENLQEFKDPLIP